MSNITDKNFKSNNSEDMRNKQIEEMAHIFCGMKNGCDHCMFRKTTCQEYADATDCYNAGYRKQKEGEWVTSDIPQEKYVCSVCGGACWYYDYQGDVAKSRYCPNCGARMKGGE